MWGKERSQPKPKGPLPAPESYDNASCGPKPDRPGLVAMGTDIEPVPLTGLAANFSPMPRMAPPPFGRLTCVAANGDEGVTPVPFSCSAIPASLSAGCCRRIQPLTGAVRASQTDG